MISGRKSIQRLSSSSKNFAKGYQPIVPILKTKYLVLSVLDIIREMEASGTL